jgi:ribokinase
MQIFKPKTFDVITFGSATRDIFLQSKDMPLIQNEKDFVSGEGICLSLGSKLNVDQIQYASGGGGTNVAATFAKQRMKTAFCGAVGTDEAALEIVREMKALGVDLRFLIKRKEKMTNHSVIISKGPDDRIILAYRGAAELVDKKHIPFKKLKAHWMYLAPLSGLLCDNFEELVTFAHKSGMKVAVNPSKQQLALPKETLRRIFKKVELLFLNQEEASFLTGISMKDETAIFKATEAMGAKVTVMTKGEHGVIASDGEHFYSAKPHPSALVVDNTGAGDAFAAGFLVNYLRKDGDIVKAMQMGMANAEANLKYVGAKTGLLAKNQAFEKVEVEISQFQKGSSAKATQ